jgi:hypothetical protein
VRKHCADLRDQALPRSARNSFGREYVLWRDAGALSDARSTLICSTW